ncbi:MAG TPA: homocysteine methyltransferase, partial [Thermoanaerobacterales bacterium]|nr:homocysteine methyltransferase [Thermoanaerobacterales bacterium]
LGVSNVSFGLPARGVLNRTFLAMALTAGLDAPILNPMEEDMISTVKAFELLWDLDKGGQEYIKKFSTYTFDTPIKNKERDRDLKKVIIDGIKEETAALTKELLAKNNALKIVDEYLIPALDVVGEKYEKGEIFLPQLIQSAETVKTAFEVLKDNMNVDGKYQNSTVSKGEIVMATVKGDIHDIGKNIVKILLENYGFCVYDLGKDVPVEKVVETVAEHNIALVGLSALMTTTVKSMEDTIKALRVRCPECKVMVGGAVLNKDYAEMIGADYYAKDARESVKVAQKFFRK